MTLAVGAPVHPREAERLKALADDQILDTAAEATFDAFALLAAQLLGTPMALVSFVDESRAWFKARVGFDVSEAPRDTAFCSYALVGDDIFEVTDASHDARFTANPHVAGALGVRFYAGAPIVGREGLPLGTLCVLDREARTLTAEQRETLQRLAGAVGELLESRRAMITLLDSARTELYHFSIETGAIAFASRAALDNLGYTLSAVRELPVGSVFPAIDVETLATAAARLDADPTSRIEIETTLRRKDATTYPARMRLEVQRARGRDLGIATVVDLSETFRAEQRIALLTTAVESANDGIVITVPEGQTASVISYANEAFLRQTGYASDEIIGQPLSIFSGPSTDRTALRSMRGALDHGASARLEYVMYRRDGSQYWVDSTVKPLAPDAGGRRHFVWIQRDVTDSVLRGIALETANEKLTTLTSIARSLFSALEPRLLIESLLFGVYELTGNDALLYAALPNGGFAITRDLGVPANDAPVGDDFIDTTAVSDLVHLSPDGERAGARVLSPSGAVVYVLEMRKAVEGSLENSDVFSLGLLAQFFAVAARNVELYNELATRRASVVELNQIKNDLIAMLAHDFQGPLTTIVGFAEVLAERDDVDEETRTFLEMISSSAQRLAGLAQDTLQLSRLEQNEFVLHYEDVDLEALVRDIARTLSVTRRIDVRAVKDAPTMRGDGPRLRQVFENLIGNAIKYSPSGESIEVVLRADGDSLEVAIRDRGIGIPSADRDKVFGRFARASNARRLGIAGTGFGLYLVRSIVELHGGTIAVTSKEGAGSTFRVQLPIDRRSAAHHFVRRVLLVDSDGAMRSYAAQALRTAGLHVAVATSFEDVINTIGDDEFDVAIVDVDRIADAPEDFRARLAAVLPKDVGLAWLGGTALGLPEGWDAFIGKPFLSKDLSLAVETAIGRATNRVARASAVRP
jgi:PAS domain S-box-containing protein